MTESGFAGGTLEAHPTFWFYVPYQADRIDSGKFTLEARLKTATLDEQVNLYLEHEIWYDASANLTEIRDRGIIYSSENTPSMVNRIRLQRDWIVKKGIASESDRTAPMPMLKRVPVPLVPFRSIAPSGVTTVFVRSAAGTMGCDRAGSATIHPAKGSSVNHWLRLLTKNFMSELLQGDRLILSLISQ